MSKDNRYEVWRSMKARCYNKNHKNYKNYGGRGITVCDEWINDFLQFTKDVGDRKEGMTLDRIDVNGNYEPKNIRWATHQEQCRNTRIIKKSKTGYKGVSLSRGKYKYRVRIYVNGKDILIGNFNDLGEAIEARKKAEQKYWSTS